MTDTDSDTATKRPRARRAPVSATEPSDALESPGGIDLGLLGESTGFLLKRAQMAVFGDFIRTFAEADLRPAQFSVLIIIARNPGLRQSEVSGALSIKRTNFVPLLDSLEERGLVKRKLATTDRRSHALYLTAKGTSLVKELNRLWGEHEQRVRALLGEDGRQQLLSLLGRILEMGGPALSDGDEAETQPAKRPRGRPRKAASPIAD